MKVQDLSDNKLIAFIVLVISITVVLVTKSYEASVCAILLQSSLRSIFGNDESNKGTTNQD